MRRLTWLCALALVACGEDEAPPPATPAGQGGGGAPNAPKPPDNRAKLQPRKHVEESVRCTAPEKPTGPACKPDAATCEPGKYCLQIEANWFCEACPERDTIRHEFKDRDFAAARDPFQSFIIVQKGLEAGPATKSETGPCNRAEQFVASNYSYLELKLVGIIAKGTQRKALMTGGNAGYMVRRGDCVGKEKALVKDIGAGYVMFVVSPDPDDKAANRGAEERSVELHPKGLQVTPQPQVEPTTQPSAPVVAPGGGPPPAPAQAPAPAPAAPVVPPR